jgi:CubicO group peptidase (beta-lactamase class C family)
VSGQPDALAPALERLIAECQADRLPSVAAAVVRKGELIWSGAVGAASYEDGGEATADTQYRIGSITKTFTATAIMQLRDAGKLDLDDRLGQHLDGVADGSPTIRRLLCHLSGLQREAGEMFVTGVSPTEDQLVESMQSTRFVLPPGEAHNYSNFAFACSVRSSPG